MFMKHKIIFLIYLTGLFFAGLLATNTNDLASNNLVHPNAHNDLLKDLNVDQREFKLKPLQAVNFFNWEKLFNNFIEDMVDVNAVVFTSLDTMKILTWTMPVYLFARYSDDIIQESFYDAGTHKNIWQMSHIWQDITSKGATALVCVFAALPLFECIDEDVRHTSLLMAKGALSLSCVRNMIKYSLKSKTALRPWHEVYSPHERTLGGFPSGHMALMAYLTSVYGLRHGPVWGVPLSAFTALSFFVSIDSNRHYASQLIGGLSLGLIYGYGTYKILNSRYGANFDIALNIDHQNRPNLSLSYDF
jgi:hypothetical protein